jgi:hypothetical protein
LEHIESLEKHANIESERATHYREQWQTTALALKTSEDTIRSLCENSRRNEELVKKLEVQLSADLAFVHGLQRRLNRLEKTGDEILDQYVNSLSASEMWRKAKLDEEQS